MKDLFVLSSFISMSVLAARMSVYRVHLVTEEAIRGHWIPELKLTKVVMTGHVDAEIQSQVLSINQCS